MLLAPTYYSWQYLWFMWTMFRNFIMHLGLTVLAYAFPAVKHYRRLTKTE